jgi:hypothetical protein
MSLSLHTSESLGNKSLPVSLRVTCAFGIILASLFTVFAVGGHVSKSHQKRHAFMNALSDFEFVGSGPYVGQLSVPPHGTEKQQVPVRFESGTAYVFHHAPVDNKQLLYSLKKRLAANGCNILELVDKGPGRFIGGLAFRIKFKDRGYKGYIFNTLDNQIVSKQYLSDSLSFDDYVLVIEKGDEVSPK